MKFGPAWGKFDPMRVSLVLVVVLVVCGVARAQDTPAPTTDDSGVTVNMDALTEPPPALPAIAHPLSRAVPRPKPVFDASVPALIVSTVPVPRQKPEMENASATPAAVPAPPRVAAVAPVVSAPVSAKPQSPVTIVENFPVELSGVAADPYANNKPFNPVAGFAVLSRVRFAHGEVQMPDSAHAVLDAVALRIIQSKQRIRLAAFSGQTGDMSSNARRLSLDRARVVRDYLVAKGVPFEQVDVLPFGGANDGVNDRVDVLAAGT